MQPPLDGITFDEFREWLHRNYISIAGAAKLCNLTESAMRMNVSRGRIDVERLGREVYIKKTVLQAWMVKGKNKGGRPKGKSAEPDTSQSKTSTS